MCICVRVMAPPNLVDRVALMKYCVLNIWLISLLCIRYYVVFVLLRQ